MFLYPDFTTFFTDLAPSAAPGAIAFHLRFFEFMITSLFSYALSTAYLNFLFPTTKPLSLNHRSAIKTSDRLTFFFQTIWRYDNVKKEWGGNNGRSK
jgi:hypothetical protein